MPSRTGDEPAALDLIMQREICAIVSVGCPLEQAALYVKCSVAQIRAAAECDPEFGQALAQAESRLEVTNLHRIHQAAGESKHWRAAAWTLERHFPQRYGTRRGRNISTGQLTLLLGQLSEWLSDLLTEIQRRELTARLEQLLEELGRGSSAGRSA